ncbi:outer membrane beta-barrel protein [Methylocystis sp. 9N]|uniref:Outer membrane beta-barrel protein n=1 Tax=Methylocystis borbori TaxID=3118750 RepID=A0ABU7XM36_9HYPH
MKWYYLSTITALSLVASVGAANAQAKLLDVDPTLIEENQPAPPPAAKPVKKGKIVKGPQTPPPPPAWADTLTVDGYVEGGVAVNFNQPFNKLNWGHLYTDRANWPTFNGAVLTVQRPLDPKAEGYDFGFKLQGMVGEDMRYNHYLGVLDYAIRSRTQIGPIEAHVLAHLPWITPFTQGGIDVKLGMFTTYNGAELIYAKDNLFYSHSYMFNFGPFIHTGAMVTSHVNSWLDVYTGVTSGVNTSLGWPGDNNAAASFHGGFGFNLLDGELTILAITHTGPENARQTDPLGVGWPVGFVGTPFTDAGWPTVLTAGWPVNQGGFGSPTGCACNVNSTIRSYNNITTTWKPTEYLTFVTDMSFMYETGWNNSSFGLPQKAWAAANAITGTGFWGTAPAYPMGATAFGIAQYASYKLNDIFKLNARAEFFRDNNNFFVAAFPGYFDAVNLAHGFWCPSCISRNLGTGLFANTPVYTGTSYLALTLGATITPELPKMPVISGLILRPEVRWDTAVNGVAPFFNRSGSSRSQGMFNMDVIVPFSLL